jgi:hypothetical protein
MGILTRLRSLIDQSQSTLDDAGTSETFWGKNRDAIFRYTTSSEYSRGFVMVACVCVCSECQQLGTVLNLPSLAKLINSKTPSQQHQQQRCISVGSILPCGTDWNRQISFFSRKPIIGMPVVIEKASSTCISNNECVEWLSVLPFCPIIGGDDNWLELWNV